MRCMLSRSLRRRALAEVGAFMKEAMRAAGRLGRTSVRVLDLRSPSGRHRLTSSDDLRIEWPSGLASCRLPREPVRIGEGSRVAADRKPVRTGAVGRDAGVFAERAAAIKLQLHRTGVAGELDVFAAEALGHREAVVDIEPLALGDVCGTQQEHDLIELSGRWAGVLLSR